MSAHCDICTDLISDLSTRIAAARTPVKFNLLLTEVNESHLPDHDKQTLRDTIAERFRQERELVSELTIK